MKYLNLLILFVFLNSSANGKIIYSDVDLGNQVPITAPIEGYDETRHLWISQNEVFKHLFHSNSNEIEKYIISLLEYTNPN